VASLADNSDVIDCSGWSGFIVHFEGLPTAATPVIDIEYIYHLEGTPQINGANTFAPVPSGLSMNYISTLAYNRVLDYASRLPWGRMVDAGVSNLGLLAQGYISKRAGLPMIKNY
jgi:hypothetical protein